MTKRHSWKGLALVALCGAAGQVGASEPDSLYMRCTMSQAHYAEVMAAPPGSARAYGDWQQWVNGQKVYGSSTLSAESLDDSGAQSLEVLIEAWTGLGGVSHYDQKTGRWQFALLQFTDNYGEMIQLLAPLRSVAPYCDAASDSFLSIYSYIWGDGDSAYLTLSNKRSQFATAPTSAQRAESNAALKTLMDSYSDSYAD